MRKIHYGAGTNLKSGYTNVDKYVEADGIVSWALEEAPYPPNSVDEILAEHLVEHLGFAEEEGFFRSSLSLLKPGGKLIIEVPDFEWVVRQFLEAEDDFKSFYQVGAIDHYFGHGPYTDNRWSLLTTAIWGNQNGEGQFHKNGYTVEKFWRIKVLVGFSSLETTFGFNKGTQVIVARFTK